jgi:hypothetical protein
MATNAERQKAYRERMKRYRRQLKDQTPMRPGWADGEWLDKRDPDNERTHVDLILYTLRETIRAYSNDDEEASGIEDVRTMGTHGISFEVNVGLLECLPEDLRAALLSSAFIAWTGRGIAKLWENDDAPVRFAVTIEPLADKRRLKKADQEVEDETEED